MHREILVGVKNRLRVVELILEWSAELKQVATVATVILQEYELHSSVLNEVDKVIYSRIEVEPRSNNSRPQNSRIGCFGMRVFLITKGGKG